MGSIEKSNLSQIEAEITVLKHQTAQNIIEIGKRLIKAKEIVPYGEWGRWLECKVDFSQSMANKFMKVATEFSDSESIPKVGLSKLIMLTTVEKEERETFIKNNPVEDMTTRELRQAMKEKKELENKIKELESKPPKVIEKEIVKEVIPEHIKDKLLDLEEEKKILEERAGDLDKARMELTEYNRKKKEIENEMESLMDTMRRLQESYDRKNSRLTLQANLLNKIKMATNPLKKSKGELERLFNNAGELDQIATKEIMSEVNTIYDIARFIEEKANEIKGEVVYFERE